MQVLLHDVASRKNVPHTIMAIKSSDGSLQWAGEASPDGTPMRQDTSYFIVSVDKLLTAIVILNLCERGNVDLDEPIATYLAERPISGIHVGVSKENQ